MLGLQFKGEMWRCKEQTSNAAASAISNGSDRIGKAKAVFESAQVSDRRNASEWCYTRPHHIRILPRLENTFWMKGIVGACLANVLSALVEQWFVRERAQAAIQLLLNHEEKINSHHGLSTQSDYSTP